MQAAVQYTSKKQQTPWFRKTNASVQCSPAIQRADIQMQAKYEEKDVENFLKKNCPSIEDALNQNKTVNIFVDDYAELLKEDAYVGRKSETNLKVCQVLSLSLLSLSLYYISHTYIYISPTLMNFVGYISRLMSF